MGMWDQALKHRFRPAWAEHVRDSYGAQVLMKESDQCVTCNSQRDSPIHTNRKGYD